MAASTKGSLIMLTVNSFVALIFSLVSFGFRGLRENETLRRGGLWEICTTGVSILLRDELAMLRHKRKVAFKLWLSEVLVLLSLGVIDHRWHIPHWSQVRYAVLRNGGDKCNGTRCNCTSQNPICVSVLIIRMRDFQLSERGTLWLTFQVFRQ